MVRGARCGGIDHITSIVFGICLGSEFWVRVKSALERSIWDVFGGYQKLSGSRSYARLARNYLDS